LAIGAEIITKGNGLGNLCLRRSNCGGRAGRDLFFTGEWVGDPQHSNHGGAKPERGKTVESCARGAGKQGRSATLPT